MIPTVIALLNINTVLNETKFVRVKADQPFSIAILYPEYINKTVSRLHSTDNFSATEAQVHLKLAKDVWLATSWRIAKSPKFASISTVNSHM